MRFAAESKGPTPLVGSLPMYAPPVNYLDGFWAVLVKLLRSYGVTDFPSTRHQPNNLLEHWRDPALVLSQTCGYPLVTELKTQVQVVGTFAYQAPGCTGVMCRSQMLVRTPDLKLPLSRFFGRTVAYNSTDSQSGYNSLRALVAPLAQAGAFFGSRVETGAHVRSIDCVRDGLADIAAIDCVTLAGVARYQPEKLHGLAVWGETAAYPGLPLITSAKTPANELALLQRALTEISQDAAYRSVCEPLFIQGFEVMQLEDYQACIDMREMASTLGVHTL